MLYVPAATTTWEAGIKRPALNTPHFGRGSGGGVFCAKMTVFVKSGKNGIFGIFFEKNREKMVIFREKNGVFWCRFQRGILESANKQDCKLIAFTSGGKMEQVCLEKNIEFRKIEEFHSPRASFPSFLYSLLNILSPIIPIKKEEVLESIQKLEFLQKEISSENLSENNPALSCPRPLVDNTTCAVCAGCPVFVFYADRSAGGHRAG